MAFPTKSLNVWLLAPFATDGAKMLMLKNDSIAKLIFLGITARIPTQAIVRHQLPMPTNHKIQSDMPMGVPAKILLCLSQMFCI